MEPKVNLNAIYTVSEDVVAREIEGELIIVPLVSGIGDLEDELFTLNETGRAIWQKLDGKQSLNEIVKKLCLKFTSSQEEIKKDVTGLLEELLKRRMVIERKNSN